MVILRSLQIILVAGFACLTSAKSAVLDATSQDLTLLVKQNSKVLVNYGSRWCAHCKKLTPEYERAAKFLSELDLEVALATVDCNDAPDKCSSVRSYPTLRLHYGWLDLDVYDTYTGPRTADDIISFMTNGTYPEERTSSTTRAPKPTSTSTTSVNQLPTPTAPNAVVISDDKTKALVKLEVPGMLIPLANSQDRPSPESFILLLFSISDDGKHLLLNHNPLALLIPDPSRPMRLISSRVNRDWNMSWIDPSKPSDFDVWKSLGGDTINLSYDLSAPNRDDPNIIYYNYYPEIHFNLIGASASTGMGTILLDSIDQKTLKINLEPLDRRQHTASNDPKRNFRITSVKFVARADDYRAPRPDDRVCSGWSWRCEDFGDPPWYQYVWHVNFDDYGRIGSARRRFLIWRERVSLNTPSPTLRPLWLILIVPLMVVAAVKASAGWRQRRWEQLPLPRGGKGS